MSVTKHYFLLMTMAILLLLSTCVSCSKEEEGQKEIIRPVKYQMVNFSESQNTRTFSGVSKSGTEIKLSFRIGGILKSVDVNEGQKIAKGMLIATLDDSDDKLKYEEAYAAMKNAKIHMDTAESNLNRTKKLYENNNTSLSEYEAAKNKYAAAEADYKSKIKRLDLQKSQISYSKLYAPMDGIISEAPVEKNENVQPGQTIVGFDSGDDLEVRVGIPGIYISRVKTGDKAKVKFSSIPARQFDGTVSEISYVSSGASTYPVKIKLKNPGKGVRPGMPADVIFKFGLHEVKKQIVVPPSAVAEDTSGNFVFVVIEGAAKGFAKVQKKSVKVGKLLDNGFEISEGLEDGELVVTSGVSKITDGMKVRFIK